LDFSEDQVNAYLASSLKTKQAALNIPFIDFKRAVAVFHEDLCLFTVERAVYGSHSIAALVILFGWPKENWLRPRRPVISGECRCIPS
ncbi:MAG: hypothetical protein ABJB69_06990, partial [Spartobacteria bacterium]